MSHEISLSNAQALALLRRAGIDGPTQITPISQRNHVWRLRQGTGTWYLKTYTKDWYGDDAAATGYCVAHEVAAWAALRRVGLAVPVVRHAEEGCDNPLGRPFLLTSELRGEPLTDILARERTLGPLAAVGEYLRRAHAITFAHPGYITATGPDAPPQEGAWQHRCWSAPQRQRDALGTLAAIRAAMPPAIATQLEALLGGMATALAPAYQPPRFVHGDCHAHQFFLYRESDRWVVSGVIDMEVSSSGDCGEDFLQLFAELATVLSPATRWWETFFAGYGQVPSFAPVRLRFLGTTPAQYAWLAERGWPVAWRDTIGHFLRATNWEELLTLPR